MASALEFSAQNLKKFGISLKLIFVMLITLSGPLDGFLIKANHHKDQL